MSRQQLILDLVEKRTGHCRLLVTAAPLARFMGSLDGGIFLSQLLYWSDRARDGWFYKSQRDWRAETALSRHRVERLTALCREMGFLEVELRRARGAPTNHYRIDTGRLAELLDTFLAAEAGGDGSAGGADGQPPAESGKSIGGPATNRPAESGRSGGSPPANRPAESDKSIGGSPANGNGEAQQIHNIDDGITDRINEKQKAGRKERQNVGGPPPSPLSEKSERAQAREPAGGAARDRPGAPFDAAAWEAVKEELRGQMARGTFEQWLLRTAFAGVEEGVLLLRAPNGRAVDTLNHRLRPVVERAVNRWRAAAGDRGAPLRVEARLEEREATQPGRNQG